MFFATTVASLALVGAAAAQNVINVQVGGTGNNLFIFNPPNVTANNGDVVQFTFAGTPGNHSVTQTSFNTPCDPLSDGFDSGNIFIPTGTPSTSSFPTWNLTITNQSQPIWFFCKQTLPSPHCSAGMVGSINAPATGNTFDNFKAAALKFQGNPPQNVGFLVGEAASASAAPGPLTGSFSGFGLPTATTPPSGASTAGSSSTSGAAATTTSSAAGLTAKASSGLTVLLAAFFGIALA